MIDIDNLQESINIEISANNTINKINENILFDKEKNNIIRLSNGEEMSKMIVGKAFKYNKELIENKEMEVEFSKKYKILSKSTALFAEIINDKKDSQQNELIKVNLNEYKESLYEESDSEDLDIEDDMGEGERRFENFSEGSKELETEEKISKESESSINKDEIEIFEESEKKKIKKIKKMKK